MAFKRHTLPANLARGSELTRDMVGIGMRFASRAKRTANIEDTLLAASVAGMQDGDLRVLAVLVTWIGMHHRWVNADRLLRAVRAHDSERTRAFWAAIGYWLGRDPRFLRFAKLHDRARIDLIGGSGTDFQIRRRGEDERFAGSPLRVPKGVLRDRPSDVLEPRVLAKRHRTYRARVVMGPTFRADMWSALELEPELSASELARRTYGSFATAWQVMRDWEMIGGGTAA